MSELIIPAIPRSPMFVNEVMTREWQDFFHKLYTRVGGYDAPTIPELERVVGYNDIYSTPSSYEKSIRELALGILAIPSPRDYSKEIDELRLRMESMSSYRNYDLPIKQLEKAMVAGVYRIVEIINTVTAAANIPANAITVGDDGAKGVKALALGAANLKLFMNAAGDANEYSSGMKIGTATHDTATDGEQNITGLGFKPSFIEMEIHVNGTAEITFGFFDGTQNLGVYEEAAGASWSSEVYLQQTSAIYTQITVTALGADGFTITWAKTGAKTGTAQINWKAYR